MRNYTLATLLVLSGCGTSAAGSGKTDDIPMCSSPDGGVCSGVPGAAGAKGEQGQTGPEGPQGVQGPQGLQGPKGDQGVQGSQGLTGPQGPIGPAGAQGSQGIQGPKGDSGPQGNAGAQGAQGVQGAAGAAGAKGADGKTMWVSGTLNGTTQQLGTLVPLASGGTGLYMLATDTSIANFPYNYIVNTHPSVFYYATSDCSGTPYADALDGALYTYSNQLSWTNSTGTKMFYQSGAQTTISAHSSTALGCSTFTPVGKNVYPMTGLSYAFDMPGSMPWMLALQ